MNDGSTQYCADVILELVVLFDKIPRIVDERSCVHGRGAWKGCGRGASVGQDNWRVGPRKGEGVRAQSAMGGATRAAWALLVLSLLSILNGLVASLYNAEKTISLVHFTNTHWITSVSLFSAIASLLAPSAATLVLASSLHLVSGAVTSCAVVADVANLVYLLSSKPVGDRVSDRGGRRDRSSKRPSNIRRSP